MPTFTVFTSPRSRVGIHSARLATQKIEYFHTIVGNFDLNNLIGICYEDI